MTVVLLWVFAFIIVDVPWAKKTTKSRTIIDISQTHEIFKFQGTNNKGNQHFKVTFEQVRSSEKDLGNPDDNLNFLPHYVSRGNTRHRTCPRNHFPTFSVS